MARPRKPTKLKVLHGDREDRIPEGEPVPAERPVEPAWPLVKAAQAVWEEHAPDRIDKGVLTAWDAVAFTAWCEVVPLIRRGAVRARNDDPAPGAPSPLSMLKDAVALADKLGGKFGWTPSDRSKLIFGGEESGSDGADLLTG